MEDPTPYAMQRVRRAVRSLGVLYHYDVCGLKTEAEKCAARLSELSTESRVAKLEEEYPLGRISPGWL